MQAKTARHQHTNACVNFQAGVGVIQPRTVLCCVIHGATPCPMCCIRHNTHLASDNMRATSVHVIKWRRGSDSEQKAVFCAPYVIEAIHTLMVHAISSDRRCHNTCRKSTACSLLQVPASGRFWRGMAMSQWSKQPQTELPMTHCPPHLRRCTLCNAEGSAPTLAPRAQAPDDASDA